MSHSHHTSTGRTVQRSALLFITIAAFIFFARFWMLFLPINVLGKMNSILERIARFVPSSMQAIFYLLLVVVVFVGGVYLLTRLYYLVAKKILERSVPAFAAFASLTLLLGILLWPTPCDTHESFFDIPNKQCNCIGWTFEFYPPLVFDGASTDYCMGWEVPVEPNP